VTIRLHNASRIPAFFERAEITATRGGDEILPIRYDDNYVTVFPGETVEIHGIVRTSDGVPAWVKLAGYNTPQQTAPIGH
jgi:exo-1,4-beta-D-glucosaminidase